MNKGKTYRNFNTNVLMSAQDYNCLSDSEKAKMAIIEIIERDMPEFSASCKQSEAKMLVITQQAFAENESLLLGAAIKYAGYFEKDITILK